MTWYLPIFFTPCYNHYMYNRSTSAKSTSRLTRFGQFITSRKPFRLYLLISLIVLSFLSLIANVSPTFAGNSFQLKRRNSQGSTITRDYFFFTDWSEGNNGVDIYKCNRSGTDISDCNKIVSNKKKYKHANVLQHIWGSNYFWVFDEGNPSNGASKWCLDFSGKEVDNTNCGSIPNNNDINSNCGSLQKQGYALYEGYFLKGCSGVQSGPNKIYVRKDKRTLKTIDAGYGSQELEDVSVDGDTGEIYYTTANTNKRILYLRKTDKYKLPVSGSGGSPSSGSSGSSGGGSVGQESTRIKPAKTKTPADVVHSQSQYDGKVETTFFGTIQENDKGCGVYSVLAFIIDVLSFGIGVAAVFGITISGIIVLTAKDNPEKVAKAKRRLLEMVLGLALYAAMYAILGFLLPGGRFNNEDCSTAYTPEINRIIT